LKLGRDLLLTACLAISEARLRWSDRHVEIVSRLAWLVTLVARLS